MFVDSTFAGRILRSRRRASRSCGSVGDERSWMAETNLD